MSYRNSNHSINRIGGTGAGSRKGQGIYEQSSVPKYDVGEKLELADGRVYRYAYFLGAAGAGLLVSHDLAASSVVDTDNEVEAAADGFAPDAGSMKFQIDKDSVTADQYAGAMFQVTDGGMQYKIKSNSATAKTRAGMADIYLYDPLQTALATTSDFAIVGNLWYNLRLASMAGVGSDYVISGVTSRAMTAAYYGWIQTAGIAMIKCDAAAGIGIGVPVQVSDSDDSLGTVQARDQVGEATNIGLSLYIGDTSGWVGVMLTGLVP